MNFLNSFIHMRRAGDVVKNANTVLDNEELGDRDKLKQLLDLEFLKAGLSGGQGNFKLVMFLCKKQNLEQLVRYSVGVPVDASNKDESYK